ncbi:MAG: DUF5916 domain-containing protein [Vicinamibacterales bacterium]
MGSLARWSSRHRARRFVVFCAFLAFGAVWAPRDVAAQAVAPAPGPSDGGIVMAGPPPPLAPAVISRDDAGRATMRATRITSSHRIDGRLEEEIYTLVTPISDFIQNDPRPGAPATERTEVWIFYDQRNFYVTARCWESDPSHQIANEMRRDNTTIAQNDGFAFGIDTFYDRRNSMAFEVNPLGGRIDVQVTNERQMNMDWNPVWAVQVGRFEGGWTVEMAIPFKSLRYQSGRSQVWGFNARRVNRWKNEVSYITKIPAAMTLRGHFLASLMGTLVGVETPPAARNIEIKPYVVSNMTTDLVATPRLSNDLGGNVGVDAKFAISQGMTGDITVNTDFAQVEADEQQVNLTRFSLFFPEKRDFFLENQGTFAFGGAAAFGPTGGAGAGQGGGANAGATSDTPILFYSRRIGLSQGGAVPIDAGGRATGRFGRYSLGLLNIQAGDHPATNTPSTNFSAVRIRRDVLRKSNIGAIFAGRSIAANGIGSNEALGVDGTFGFYDNLTINTYWAATRSDGLSGEDSSYRGQLDYNGDRYAVQLERMRIGRNFNPEVGFIRRGDQERSFAQLRFSPRPRRMPKIRRFFSMGSIAYIENTRGRLETRDIDVETAIEYQNGDRPQFAFSRTYEFLPNPFTISTGVTLPSAGYEFTTYRFAHNLGNQRRLSGLFSFERGSFYGGTKTSYGWARGRVFLTPQFSVEPRFSVDDVKLVQGNFTSTLLGTRATFSATPWMFVSALVQYSSAARSLSANIRFRWEYRPGSEMFVVWNEQRDTLLSGFPNLANRALIIKVNRLFRF